MLRRVKRQRREVNYVRQYCTTTSKRFSSIRLPDGWWQDIKNQRAFLDWLGKEVLQVDRNPNNWYSVTNKLIVEHGGAKLLQVYRGSARKALQTLIPEHDWKPWKFRTKLSTGVWNNDVNRREFLDSISIELKIAKLEDWYSVTLSAVRKCGGRSIARSQSELAKTIMNAYPQHEWKPWLFDPPPKNWWRNPVFKRRFFEYAAERIGVHSLEDWYGIESTAVKQLEVPGSLERQSLPAALIEAYPQHTWLPWLFKSGPVWINDAKYQRLYMDWLGKIIGVQNLDDWYKVTWNDFKRNKGSGLLAKFSNSPSQVVMSVYSHHPWKPWRFVAVPHNYWSELHQKALSGNVEALSMLQSFLEDVAQINGFHVLQIDKWYETTSASLPYSVAYALNHFGGLFGALRLAFPHLDLVKYSAKVDIQKQLMKQVSEVIPYEQS